MKPTTIREMAKIEPLKNLRTLSLQNLTLTSVDTNLLAALTNLEELDLSHNFIEFINPTAFPAPLPNLIKISLAGNNLRDLDVEKLLVQFPNLVQIDIRDNKWKCGKLEEIVAELQSRNVTLTIAARDVEGDNVNGVTCKNWNSHLK